MFAFQVHHTGGIRMNVKVNLWFLSDSNCLPTMHVKELNEIPGINYNVFVDLITSCSGYLEGISVYAVNPGTFWIDLWEQLTNTYILRQSIRVVVSSTGLHTFLPLPDGAVSVEPGLTIGYHFVRGAAMVLSAAQSDRANLEATGYTIPEMSGVFGGPRFSDDLFIGDEVSPSLVSFKRMPSFSLHITKAGMYSLGQKSIIN